MNATLVKWVVLIPSHALSGAFGGYRGAVWQPVNNDWSHQLNILIQVKYDLLLPWGTLFMAVKGSRLKHPEGLKDFKGAQGQTHTSTKVINTCAVIHHINGTSQPEGRSRAAWDDTLVAYIFTNVLYCFQYMVLVLSRSVLLTVIVLLMNKILRSENQRRGGSWGVWPVGVVWGCGPGVVCGVARGMPPEGVWLEGVEPEPHRMEDGSFTTWSWFSNPWVDFWRWLPHV